MVTADGAGTVVVAAGVVCVEVRSTPGKASALLESIEAREGIRGVVGVRLVAACGVLGVSSAGTGTFVVAWGASALDTVFAAGAGTVCGKGASDSAVVVEAVGARFAAVAPEGETRACTETGVAALAVAGFGIGLTFAGVATPAVINACTAISAESSLGAEDVGVCFAVGFEAEVVETAASELVAFSSGSRSSLWEVSLEVSVEAASGAFSAACAVAAASDVVATASCSAWDVSASVWGVGVDAGDMFAFA